MMRSKLANRPTVPGVGRLSIKQSGSFDFGCNIKCKAGHDGHPKRCSSCLLWHPQRLSLPLCSVANVAAIRPCNKRATSLWRVASRLAAGFARHGALFNDTIRATPTHCAN
ncbi:hypothetical protein ACLKA7_011449 [Drosophila subpalustris]